MSTSTPDPTPVRGGLFAPQDEIPTGSVRPDPELGGPPAESAALALDHRSRLRSVPLGLARRGHHLAFEGADGLELLPLRERVTHVGRSLTAQIRLEDFRVSRDHAILVRHGDHVRVLDNRSANGTFVNGQRVLATTLRDGDTLEIGPLRMRYVRID